MIARPFTHARDSYWAFWDGVAIPVSWDVPGLVQRYADKVQAAAAEGLARRSPDRSRAYESLLMLRLNELKDKLMQAKHRIGQLVPLDVLDPDEVDYWFITIAQLEQLGAIAEDDDNNGLLLVLGE